MTQIGVPFFLLPMMNPPGIKISLMLKLFLSDIGAMMTIDKMILKST